MRTVADGCNRRGQRALSHLCDGGCQGDGSQYLAVDQTHSGDVAGLTDYGFAIDHRLLLGCHGQ